MRIALALLLAGLLSHPAASTAGPAPDLPWRGWDRGLEEARTTGRPVLVDVFTDWCGWCRRMKADVYSRPEIREYLGEHFVLVSLDAEGADPARYEGRAFTSRSLAARFGVGSYPTTLFLRSDGEHLVNVPGYLESSRFLQVLRYVGDGHLERGVSFQEFSKPTTPGAARRQ